jgi:prepilin-type N-terminal cleavage/methylation domain-containing protein
MKKSCLGFTIIELLVTISIIAILFGLGAAKYNEFNRRQIIAQAANELKSNLILAQDKALSGEKDCRVSKCGGNDGVCGTNDANERSLEGWFVRIPSPPNNTYYEIYGQCGGITFPDVPKRVDLSQRGLLITSSLSAPIHFYPLGLGVEEEAVITLSHPGYGLTEELRVNKAGEIY